MTPSLHHNAINPERSARTVRRAFTLIELLVVMGIILLLIALLLPAVERAYRESVRTAMAADLQTISEAIEIYRTTFGDIPRAGTNGTYESQLLCWALVAPGPAKNATNIRGDGADGPGFRLRGDANNPTSVAQGTVYGPYLSPDRFPMGTQSNNNVIPITNGKYDDNWTVFADRYGHVIHYFPANKSVSPSTGFVGNYNRASVPPQAYYNYQDNNVAGGYLTMAVFAYRLGHTSVTWGTPGSTGPPAVNAVNSVAPSGTIWALAPGEIPILAPYILWSAGPDGVFGPKAELPVGMTSGEDDDVTYPILNDVPAGVVP